MNAFTKPTQSFALSLQNRSAKAGGVAAARKARGIAVPGLSNLRGKTPPRGKSPTRGD